MGNWSVAVVGSVLSGPRGSGVQVQAGLDHREKIRLNGTIEGRCLQATAGYMNGKDATISTILAKYIQTVITDDVFWSRSAGGCQCGGMCGNKSQFDVGCAEKWRQQQTWNLSQCVCAIGQSEADAESQWLFGKSNWNRGITANKKKWSNLYCVQFDSLKHCMLFYAHRQGFNIWALRFRIRYWRESKLYNITSLSSDNR